ncbi:MAG: SufD family Fe-S cluster assembly protein [Bacilli bacterium]|nr:SufD family Fe-S cluster assembly protein [Bacilli bacterium]MDD4076404.1 SufD family Fe-S cluster assembly protein [Bacilli bacterium]MDD4388454.1 SufD family Fe-S cluster assembly protein [Bacilli bacterium]
MIDLIKKELIDPNEEYVIYKNGKFIFGNGPRTLNIKRSGSLKIIHVIDDNAEIMINVNAGIAIALKEVFYKVTNNSDIKITLHVGDGARVDYISFKQNNECDNIGFTANTIMGENSYINNKNLSIFSSESKLIDNIYLKNINSKIDMENVIINVSGEKQFFQYDIYHQAAATTSTMNNYGISKYKSVLDIKSNGIIEKNAKKTQLIQKTKGLIIDMYSAISADPILRIDEYDCIANHGASIGAINEDELYYLMSRGLSYEDAEKLIISGFINPFFVDMSEDKSVDFMKFMIDKIL